MKNNNRKSDAEIDDMNIKSHLNTSLDLSGISVSEDLINRTLSAIKQQQEEQKDKANRGGYMDCGSDPMDNAPRKVIPWNRYIRTVAGIAAAFIVVVAGYGAIRVVNTNFIGQKNDEAAYDSSKAGDNKKDAGDAAEKENSALMEAPLTEESTLDMASESMASEDAASAPQYTITAEDAWDENKLNSSNGATDGATDGAGLTGASASGQLESEGAGDKTVSKNSETDDGGAIITFREIFLSDPQQAEYVKITDETNKIEITLTKQEDIDDFYIVMDEQQFTYGTNSSVEQNYKVELKKPQPGGEIYTMTIGELVVVDYEMGETVSHSSYKASDLALLKQRLDEFIRKYS